MKSKKLLFKNPDEGIVEISYSEQLLSSLRRLLHYAPHAMIGLITLFFIVMLFFAYVVTPYFFLTHSLPEPKDTESVSIDKDPESCKSQHVSSSYGFLKPAVKSTVLMLFSKKDAYHYVYNEKESKKDGKKYQIEPDTPLRRSVLEFSEKDWSASFQRVAAAFLTSPIGDDADPSKPKDANPFYDFFRDHGATFWTIENDSVAVPMRLDIIYTFVNPEAPSFRRHLNIREVPYTPERYNDWQELRYSMRALAAYALENHALSQHGMRRKDQLEEDRQTLESLGYQVQLRSQGSDDEGATDPLQGSLIRRVYLVLSDRDQVPAWLDLKAFPMLRVVTHADMFSNPEAEPDILPTLNSNVIESGLYRIPGLSRFFLYINNDFMFSRRLSFFDLFRPLSPARQQLYTLQNAVQGPAQSHLRRRFVHLEPLTHSEDMYSNPVKYRSTGGPANLSKVRSKQKLCLNSLRRHLLQRYAKPTLDQLLNKSYNTARGTRVGTSSPSESVLLEMLQQAGWKTPPGFAMPDPNITETIRGAGIGPRYYYHIMMKNFDGVEPPFIFAHAPQLMDREVMARLTESELHYLTRETRLAFEREMHPFSPVDVYPIFAASMARTATREAWAQQARTRIAQCIARKEASGGVCPEAWREWLQQIEGELLTVPKQSLTHRSKEKKLSFDELGPMYGSTFDVRLQDPNLFREMGFWWLPEMRPVHKSRNTLRLLYDVYQIPYISVCTFGEHKCDGAKTMKMGLKRLDDQYVSLLQDMFHHELTTQSYHFEMLHSHKQAQSIAMRLYFEGKKRALWIGLNDNFLYASGQLRKIQEISFQITMIESTGGAPAAAWEKK